MTVSINGTTGFVFSDGNTQNAAAFSGFRNQIINGNFDIWQRGTSFTANSVYTADRWWFVNDTVGSASVSRIDISSLGIGSQYALRTERTAGTNRWVVGTNLETDVVKKMLGKQVTLSIKLRKGSALTSDIGISWGTSGQETRYGSLIDSNNFTVLNSSLNTSTFTTVTSTISVPASSAAVGFKIEISASQAGASGAYFDVAQVQVEHGGLATPIEIRPVALENMLCKRYYEKNLTRNFYILPCASGTQIQRQSVYYTVQKRAAGTITLTTVDAGGGSVGSIQTSDVDGYYVALSGNQYNYVTHTYTVDAEL